MWSARSAHADAEGGHARGMPGSSAMLSPERAGERGAADGLAAHAMAAGFPLPGRLACAAMRGGSLALDTRGATSQVAATITAVTGAAIRMSQAAARRRSCPSEVRARLPGRLPIMRVPKVVVVWGR